MLFDAINLDKYRTFVVFKGRTASSWVFILSKRKTGREIDLSRHTTPLCQDTQNVCEGRHWYPIEESYTRGLPRGRRYTYDGAPTLEEIKKLCEYTDRRIKATSIS